VPRTITDAQVEQVVVRTLERVPPGAAHWPEQELAWRASISPSSVLRSGGRSGLQPWRTETFKVCPDPLLTGLRRIDEHGPAERSMMKVLIRAPEPRATPLIGPSAIQQPDAATLSAEPGRDGRRQNEALPIQPILTNPTLIRIEGVR
jgi:hypothetical protein